MPADLIVWGATGGALAVGLRGWRAWWARWARGAADRQRGPGRTSGRSRCGASRPSVATHGARRTPFHQLWPVPSRSVATSS